MQPDTGTTQLADAIENNTFDLFIPSNNTAEEIAALSSNQETTTGVEMTVIDLVVTGEVGDVSIASGLQFRDESIDIDRSANSLVVLDADGNLVTPANMIFLGGGIEVDQEKSASAIFVEASTDLTDNLELRGALRYENLEDDSTVDPKLSQLIILNDGIRVNSPKDIIYFLFATEPLTFILFFIEFFISIKIKKKNNNKKTMLQIKTNCKFFSFNSIKLLSMKVRKVIKDRRTVRRNIIIINKFLFIKASINYEYI